MAVDALRSARFEVSNATKSGSVKTREEVPRNAQPKIIWTRLIFYGALHAAFLTIYSSGLGVTAGAHRLWAHKSYKAKLPLKLILLCLFTTSGQGPAFTWILNHRLHHKHSDTDADPHNVNRGLFFAHIGWLFTTSHPEVVAEKQAIYMSDVEDDPLLMWQTRYYWPLFVLLSIVVPVSVPWYFWNEALWICFWVNFNFRLCATLNITFTVNSIGHTWINRPYDKYISPVDSAVMSVVAFGDGWHNYHHAFPWDYKTGEFGDYKFNATTAVIDGFARLGWAYDRKSVSPEMVKRRATRLGDGSRVWGYGDRDIPKEDRDHPDRMLDQRSR